MLGQQQNSLLQGHGLLKDLAKSVLNEQELALFMYHINQYQQFDLPVEELVPPIINILDTPEKVRARQKICEGIFTAPVITIFILAATSGRVERADKATRHREIQ